VNVTVFGFLPVVPMVLGSAACMLVGSLLTRPPSAATIAKYFPGHVRKAAGRAAGPAPAVERYAARAR
jgi:hypothetical protein